jgi:hypothetical protein
MLKDMLMTFVSWQWVNAQTQYGGSCGELCILWNGGAKSTVCRLIRTRQDRHFFPEKEIT